MKKTMALTLLCLGTVGFAIAGELDFHLGAGYHGSFYGDIDGIASLDYIETAKSMPLGVGGYVGLGFGKVLSFGVEVAPSWDFNLGSYQVSNLALQVRAYSKFKLPALITTAVFGGFSMNLAGSPDNPGSLVGSPIFGLRLTVLFFYAEYGLTPKPDFSGILKHEIGVGVALYR